MNYPIEGMKTKLESRIVARGHITIKGNLASLFKRVKLYNEMKIMVFKSQLPRTPGTITRS